MGETDGTAVGPLDPSKKRASTYPRGHPSSLQFPTAGMATQAVMRASTIAGLRFLSTSLPSTSTTTRKTSTYTSPIQRTAEFWSWMPQISVPAATRKEFQLRLFLDKRHSTMGTPTSLQTLEVPQAAQPSFCRWVSTTILRPIASSFGHLRETFRQKTRPRCQPLGLPP